jgi:hypothetical protein
MLAVGEENKKAIALSAVWLVYFVFSAKASKKNAKGECVCMHVHLYMCRA